MELPFTVRENDLKGDCSRLNRLLVAICGQIGAAARAPASPAPAANTTITQVIQASAAGLIKYGTHSSRLVPSSDVVADGTFWCETDRTVCYQFQVRGAAPGSWYFAGGVMLAALADQPTDLDENAASFLFYATDTSQLYRWTGSAWVALAISDAVLGYSALTTAGYVPFITALGTLGIDLSGGLFWDVATHRLGVLTAVPGHPISVAGIIESTTGGFMFPDASTQVSSGAPVAYAADVQTNKTTGYGPTNVQHAGAALPADQYSVGLYLSVNGTGGGMGVTATLGWTDERGNAFTQAVNATAAPSAAAWGSLNLSICTNGVNNLTITTVVGSGAGAFDCSVKVLRMAS